MLGWEAGLTVAVVCALVVALVRDVARPDLLLLGGVGVLLVAGVLTPAEAFGGFSNPAVLTIAALYVVAAGVQRTDALAALDRVLFRRGKRMGPTLARFMLPTAVLSGFLNNTPIVAMLMPRLQQWAERHGISASKLMIPLSYAAITGGMLTLIGTSTNLVVSGLLEAEGYEALGLFDVTWVGVPATVCVLAYFAFGGHRLLPDRSVPAADFKRTLQKGLFEMKVAVQSPLAGQTVEEAGLRALKDAYLVHIRRGEQVMPATPRTVLEQGDVLAFTGTATAIRRLLRRPGLKRNLHTDDLLDADKYHTLPLFEAVVADSSHLVGKTLREVNFRERYQAVVLGIQRKDEAIHSPIGQTPIQAGDQLFVEASNDFEEHWGQSRDEFYLVVPRQEEAEKPEPWKAPLALIITGGMMAAAATGLVPIVTAAFAAALLMVVTRCISGAEAQQALNIQVLVVIAAALGLGRAVEETGLARLLADGILTVDAGPIAALFLLYVATNLLTELITNNAAAVLMLPVSLSAASSLGAPPKAFAVIVAVAASASFITPIGYQTNLMVMSPGGYRFSDYARTGWPVSLAVMGTAVAVIALVWL